MDMVSKKPQDSSSRVSMTFLHLTVKEVMSPQLLVTEPLKIKGITRDQSRGNVVFLFPDRSFKLWQGNELCARGLLSDPLWSLPFLASPLPTLRTFPHLPEEPSSSKDADIFSGGERQISQSGSLLCSTSKIACLQANLFPFSTLSETPSLPHLMQILWHCLLATSC